MGERSKMVGWVDNQMIYWLFQWTYVLMLVCLNE